MTVDVREVTSGKDTHRLVAIMVKPLPSADDGSEFDLLIDLLAALSVLFGPMEHSDLPDARCRYATWDGLHRPLEFLWRGGLSPRYLQHLLHLAGHFAQRHGLRRSGSAVLSLYDEDAATSFRYDIPMCLSREEAHEWSMRFWDELGSVDLLKPNFIIVFTEAAETSASVSHESLP